MTPDYRYNKPVKYSLTCSLLTVYFRFIVFTSVFFFTPPYITVFFHPSFLRGYYVRTRTRYCLFFGVVKLLGRLLTCYLHGCSRVYITTG